MQHKHFPTVTLLTMVLICALAVGSCDWFATAPPEPATVVEEGSPIRPPIPLGDAQPGGVTHLNNLGLGEGLERDTALTFDGNAQDFYIALDDSVDDLLIGLGSTVGTNPGFGLDENLAIATYGDVTMGGTTPVLTVGDAGAEDTTILFDGNAQDFYIALDDTADDLLIGLGSTVGTTGIIYCDESQDVGLGGASAGAKLDVTGNVLLDGAADEIQLTVQGYTTQTNVLQTWEQSDGTDVSTLTNLGALDILGLLTYSSDDRTPIGFDGSTGYEVYFGSGSSITQTTVTSATHNMTTAVDWGICFVSDPDADAGDPFMCTISISGTSITFQALDDDGDNAATAATKIYYLIVGR
jgi:hypothetical protein